MKENYHTHTRRCNHAFGNDEDYVKAAISSGIKVLGFSDHAPYRLPEECDSWYRMKPEQTEEYVESLLKLRERYKDKIDIKIGFEAELYPDYFEDLLKTIEGYPVDYLILGQHYNYNEVNAHYCGDPTDDTALLDNYVDTCIRAIRSGRFTYIAHPDIFRYTGSDDIYRERMLRLCAEARGAGVPLELNLLGLRDGRHYPSERLFRIAGEAGAGVILGIDAHSPDEIRSAPEADARRFAGRCGVNIVNTVKLRNPL